MEGWPGPSLNWRAYACCIYACRLSCSCTSSEGGSAMVCYTRGFESTKGTCVGLLALPGATPCFFATLQYQARIHDQTLKQVPPPLNNPLLHSFPRPLP